MTRQSTQPVKATPMTDAIAVKHTGELLPCPFCGGAAELDGHTWIWAVRCIADECWASVNGLSWNTAAEAVIWWNKRSHIPSDDLLSALKHAVRWHDQLSADDISRFNAAISRAEGHYHETGEVCS